MEEYNWKETVSLPKNALLNTFCFSSWPCKIVVLRIGRILPVKS
jgi:hypothetical protein